MKSSSAEAARPGSVPQARRSEHLAGGVLDAAAASGLRAARLDHPLRGHQVDPLYADAGLEALVEKAADRARESARAQGYAAGWAQGRQAAAEAAAQDSEHVRRQAAAAADAFAMRARTALQALDAATRAQRAATGAELAEVGEAIAEGALALAAAALGRELASVDAEVAEAVRTALRLLGTTDVTVVHVHPEDLRVLAGLPAGTVPDGVRLAGDPDVPRGGALAVSSSRQVLAHLPTALDAAREAMLP